MNSDAFNFLSKLSLRRLWNASKIVTSYFISIVLKKPLHWGMPISISVEPTTSCNLRCPECPSGKRAFTRPTGMLQKSFFKNTLDELHKDMVYLIFYFQGEPYLNPDFLEMVKYASSKNIYTATSTNAHYLDDENARKTVESSLDRLIISIDGTTQDTYEQYRVGGDLKRVVAGAENIVKWKKKLKSTTPHLIFQFLVVQPNQHQINDIEILAKKIGVDEVKFKTAQIYDYVNGSKLIPTIEKYSRYRKQADGTYDIKSKMRNQCWKMWHSTVITWDGLLVPCCFDKDATHQMGDLKFSNFKQLWRGNKYNNFRTSVLTSRSQIDICKNCTEGTKVWL